MTTALAPKPIDLSTEPFLRGVFAPVTEEVDVVDLKVEGELPPEIDGEYVRNGSNPRFAPLGSYLYPIDGDGMIHRIQIRDGRVRYTNRFVRTPSLIAEEGAGRAIWPGLSDLGYRPGAELVGPALADTVKEMPTINVVRHAGKLLALGESATPFLLSPELTTIGPETFCDTLPAGITAHPKIDPLTGEMVVFCYGFSEPYLTWSVIGRDGATVRAATPVEGIDRPAMIHDMALTPSYVVLVVAPLFFDLADAARSRSPLSWQPAHGTRIALIPRNGDPVRWLDTDAFWLWHTANAYEELHADGSVSVVLDYARWSLPGGFAPGRPVRSLARMRLDPERSTVRHETLVARPLEFPRIDDRLLTRQHRWIATSTTLGADIPGSGQDTLAWYDTQTQEFAHWGEGARLWVGEQTFVPRPGDADPRHGWWITIATSHSTLTSQLLVFAAEDPAHGPIARVRLPRRVPVGQHGNWLPDSNPASRP
jgi:carotenoid cleavage dioxygenase-like enzyme